MKNFFSKERSSLNTAFLCIVFFVFGVAIGFRHETAMGKMLGIKQETAANTTADFTPFWKVWNTLNEKFPDAAKVSDQDRVYGAIAGLTASMGDPYTTFFKPDEAKSFQEQIAGAFGGIGVEIGIKDNVLTVIAPLKDTPGDRAGIKPGDKILKIDSTSTANMTVEKAISLIRGTKGTTVTLTILPLGEQDTKEVKIVRDTINVPTLDTELRPDGIFVVRLYSFSANSATLFRDAMKKFGASKSDKLLLDLRGNPGGYLDAAVNMASWFLPNGKTIVTEDYGGTQEPKVYRSLGYSLPTKNLKFVILIDSGSASASEILAGAMQDSGKAKLVGTQSYGKGSVQEVIPVTADTILKVTVAKWLTPNGTWISLKGLTPDFKVEYTKADATAKRDPQMDKGAELLNNWTAIPAKK